MNQYEKALKQLNPAQREAVNHIEGPLMVLAGPGTGKTQVIALRIAHILQQTQLSASNILALTFTDAGVTALRLRLKDLIGAEGQRVTVATFHGLCEEIIRTFPYYFPIIGSAGNLDELERTQVIEQALKKSEPKLLRPLRNPDYYLGQIGQAIKTCKREAISAEALRHYAQKIKPEQAKTKASLETLERQRQVLLEFSVVFEHYQEILDKVGRYDYEDMILWVNVALTKHGEIRASLQERYQYLLVDEYQDTNTAQNQLVDQLADFFEEPNLCVVGDDKQAIFRFQGASVANMLHFKKKYPQMKVVTLTKNYRSTPEILKSAATLIDNNQHQLQNYLPEIKSILEACQSIGPKPELVTFKNRYAQAQGVLELLTLAKKDGLPYSQMAVLLRKNSDVIFYRNFLEKAGLPLAGQTSLNLLEDPIGQAILAFLKAVATLDPTACLSAFRLLNPAQDLPALYDIFRRGASHFLKNMADHGLPSHQAVLRQILDLNQQQETLTLVEFLEEALVSTDIISKIGNTKRRLEVVATLLRLAQNFKNQASPTHLNDWLENLELATRRSLDFPLHLLGLADEGINVTTVHGAKGLEYELVVMAEADEKRWSLREQRQLIPIPSELIELKNWQDNVVEDERRLFYVGLTRAKKKLVISYANTNDEGEIVLPCQFAEEIRSTCRASSSDQDGQKGLLLAARPISPEKLKKQTQEWIWQQIKATPLSPTDLNTYKTCPRRYLLNRVFRVPTLPSPSLDYGNAVHRALELLARKHMASRRLPSKEYLLEAFEQAILTGPNRTDQERNLELGQIVLSEYYDQKLIGAKVPLAVEYSFTSHLVELEGIPITGKFDRIENIDAPAKTVRIVDYKTAKKAKSQNEVLGQTKNSDGAYYQQLVFYSLLADLDRSFTYLPIEYTLRFIDDELRFPEYTFTISREQRQKLSAEIKEIRSQMLTDKSFSHLFKDYTQGCEYCRIVVV